MAWRPWWCRSWKVNHHTALNLFWQQKHSWFLRESVWVPKISSKWEIVSNLAPTQWATSCPENPLGRACMSRGRAKEGQRLVRERWELWKQAGCKAHRRGTGAGKATVCSVCPKEAELLHENSVYSQMHALTWQTNMDTNRGRMRWEVGIDIYTLCVC